MRCLGLVVRRRQEVVKVVRIVRGHVKVARDRRRRELLLLDLERRVGGLPLLRSDHGLSRRGGFRHGTLLGLQQLLLQRVLPPRELLSLPDPRHQVQAAGGSPPARGHRACVLDEEGRARSSLCFCCPPQKIPGAKIAREAIWRFFPSRRKFSDHKLVHKRAGSKIRLVLDERPQRERERR